MNYQVQTTIALTPEQLGELVEDRLNKVLANYTPPAPEGADLPELLTRRQTSETLQVSLTTLHDWATDTDDRPAVLLPLKINGRVRYRRADVLAALKQPRRFKTPKGAGGPGRMTYLPTSHRLTFRLDADRGRYLVKECEPGFCKVPRELIVEERRFNENIDAEFILRGPQTQKKGTGKGSGRKITFFTGLQRTDQTGVYLGNVLTFGQKGNPVRNGVVVQFSTDAGRMVLRYFPAYYPYPKERAAFVSAVLDGGLL